MACDAQRYNSMCLPRKHKGNLSSALNHKKSARKNQSHNYLWSLDRRASGMVQVIRSTPEQESTVKKLTQTIVYSRHRSDGSYLQICFLIPPKSWQLFVQTQKCNAPYVLLMVCFVFHCGNTKYSSSSRSSCSSSS